MDNDLRRIVCAANRNRNGLIFCGARHYDSVMRQQMLSAVELENRWEKGWLSERCEEGFIDQYGAFLTRTEAWQVALAAGQIIRHCGGENRGGGTLFSENLY